MTTKSLTPENFTYDKFAFYADQAGMFQAIWLAKWIGVKLNVVKSYVSLYLGK